MTTFIAVSIRPPSHPALEVSQLRRCCSDKSTVVLVYKVGFVLISSDSKKATDEKAQQLPQSPWSFTGVTIFLVLQSRLVGAPRVGFVEDDFVVFVYDAVDVFVSSTADSFLNPPFSEFWTTYFEI